MKNSSIEDQILEKERDALNYWADGDVTGYLRYYSEEATYYDDIGAMNRLDGLIAIKEYAKALTGQIPKHKYEMVNPKVQVYGDVAILTLRYHPSSFEGAPLTPWKATSVYIRTNDDWKVVHGHWSMIKDNKPG